MSSRGWSAGALAIGLVLQGCSSGSGGSDVGAHTAEPPTARVQVLNGGTTGTFREGAEVLLTGKASEDADGPPIAWSWRQTAGPAVRLIETSSAAVSFTAPHVQLATELRFELTVTDSTGHTGGASAAVTVVPARDSDKFLSLDVARGVPFDTFEIVAALASGAATGAVARPFTLSAEAYLAYPPRGRADTDCRIDPADFASGIPQSTRSGCHVAWLTDLTPQPLAGGGTGLAGEWPAGIEAPDDSEALRISRWWNRRFSVPVPRLDVHEFNQRFVDSGERERLLDSVVAHRAHIVLTLSLTAPENQQDAVMILPGFLDAPIPLPNQGLAMPPVSGTASIENAGVGLPTTAVLPLDTVLASIDGREADLTTAVYYRTVDPNGTRASLNAWLRQAGFTAADGRLRPEAVAGTGEFAHAVYVNNFDLGFGRQMYTRTDELGNVFSFVKNYGTLEGAIRQIDSFATVVTEYSPLGNHADPTPKFVKFFTYVEDGSGDAPRVASFDFDGRGERFTPGNCVVCHGGARPPGLSELVFDGACGDRSEAVCYAWPAQNRDGVAVAGGDLGGTFLPWDVGSLLFADTDPAITGAPTRFDGVGLQTELRELYGDFSRSRQQAQLKKLNQAAYKTYTARHDAVRRLVEQWYGGVDANGNLVAPTFDDSMAVPGWRNGELVPDVSNPANPAATILNPPTTEDLYHTVYAQHCRMCHTSMPDGPLRFDTYQEFVAQREFIRQTVFRVGSMPSARLTMDRFWVPFAGGIAPGDRLAAHIASLRAEESELPPGKARADIAGFEPLPNRGDTVHLDGGGSAFADSYSWSLLAPGGSAAALAGASGQRTAFVVDLPGTYAVSVTVNAGTANEATLTKSVQVVNRAPTVANDLYSLDLVASSVLHGSVLAGAQQDADPDGDALTVALAAGGAPSFGDVAIGADGSFTYSYTRSVLLPADSDNFRYQIADGVGGTAQASVKILLNGAAAAERPAAIASLSAVDGSTAAASSSVFVVQLQWPAASDDDQVIGYNVYRDGALLTFLPSAVTPGAAVLYADNTARPNTTHRYRVTTLDAQSESDLSGERVITIAPSLRQSIQRSWGAGTDSLWRASGCIGCHRGAAGGLTLSAPAADGVYAELNENASDLGSRRIDSARPMRSLLLCKPLVRTNPNSCPHEGGSFFVSSDPRFQVLLNWVRSGAPNN